MTSNEANSPFPEVANAIIRFHHDCMVLYAERNEFLHLEKVTERCGVNIRVIKLNFKEIHVLPS